ncbi:MAG: right-handed parallel beta-helix repeat-containing protein [Coriobacteriaceae bacterium]|nr:right-handed parallel beta-helix repeat-containing protein [Coriobacteriaceae bacterium]
MFAVQNRSSKLLMLALAAAVVACACTLVCVFGTNTAQAATKTVNVTKAQIKKKGATDAIQSALNKAKKKAKPSKQYKVVVAKGSYNLNTALHLYSNTTLSLKGVKLKMTKDYSLIVVGTWNDKNKGYHYKNIAVEGGNLNENKKGRTLMKVAHTANFTMSGTTLQKTRNAHLMEVAGVKNLKITGCKFKNQKIKKKAADFYYEAIQIDILQKTHFTGYRLQDLPNKNITIDKCSFSNVPRGVGSHTAVLNNPVNGIKITNCKFNKCDSAAVQGLNWINATISGNKIKKCTRGIAVYAIQQSGGMFLGKTLAKQGHIKTKTSSKYKKPSSNQNIVISNNTVACSGKDPYTKYEPSAINVEGTKLTKTLKIKNKAYGDNVPKGNYYISGVTVSNNTVKKGKSYGIRLADVKNATCQNNTVTSSGDCIRVMNNATVSKVANNKISGGGSAGIWVNEDGQINNIEGNTISGCAGRGISINSLTANMTIQKNTISKCKGEAQILLNPATDSYTITVKNNTLTATSGKWGIRATAPVKATVEGNTIKASSEDDAISYTKNKAKITIGDNTITKL